MSSKKDGNVLDAIPQFAEFLAAVIKALAKIWKMMDSTTAQGWIGDAKALEKILSEALLPPESNKLLTSLNPTWLSAREIMGQNFFGIEEAIKHFGINPSKQQLAALAEVPFSEEILAACKNTHVLVAIFPLSILDIRDRVVKITLPNEQRLLANQDWYNKRAFAKDCGEIGWHLIRKTAVSDSTNKNWAEQQGLLTQDEETPNACVMVYTIVGHCLATGEQLFKGLYVRTSSVDSDGAHVDVGYFPSDGLLLNYGWDADRRSSLGLASSRKSN